MISVPSRNRTESQPAETAQLFLGWALSPASLPKVSGDAVPFDGVSLFAEVGSENERRVIGGMRSAHGFSDLGAAKSA